MNSPVGAMDKLTKWFPIALAIFAVIAAGVTAQSQISIQGDTIKELTAFNRSTMETLLQVKLNQREIEDLSESVDDNEDWLGELQWSINELEKR